LIVADSLHGHRFDHVGIQGSLHQVLDAAIGLAMLQFQRFFGEHGDEFIADDLPFLFGVSHAFQFAQEAVGGIHPDHAQA
jgi:hypothetical protein